MLLRVVVLAKRARQPTVRGTLAVALSVVGVVCFPAGDPTGALLVRIALPMILVSGSVSALVGIARRRSP